MKIMFSGSFEFSQGSFVFHALIDPPDCKGLKPGAKKELLERLLRRTVRRPVSLELDMGLDAVDESYDYDDPGNVLTEEERRGLEPHDESVLGDLSVDFDQFEALSEQDEAAWRSLNAARSVLEQVALLDASCAPADLGFLDDDTGGVDHDLESIDDLFDDLWAGEAVDQAVGSSARAASESLLAGLKTPFESTLVEHLEELVPGMLRLVFAGGNQSTEPLQQGGSLPVEDQMLGLGALLNSYLRSLSEWEGHIADAEALQKQLDAMEADREPLSVASVEHRGSVVRRYNRARVDALAAMEVASERGRILKASHEAIVAESKGGMNDVW
jgi:hypothetical protein